MSGYEFQKTIFDHQLFWENILRSREEQKGKDTIILCDRSFIDGKAYLDNSQWSRLLREYHFTDESLFSRYDYYVHFQSTAVGAEEAYSNVTNKQRRENLEEAKQNEENIKAAYVGVDPNNYFCVDNSTDFQGKVERALNAILGFLGETPITIMQRKFLVPRAKMLEMLKAINTVSRGIEQTYLLDSTGKEEIKIRAISERKTDSTGNYKKFFCVSKDLSGKRGIMQELISRELAENMIDNYSIPSLSTVKKRRYYFFLNGMYCNLDVFDDKAEYALLEIRSDKPETIKVSEQNGFPCDGLDVSFDMRFLNRSIAAMKPNELYSNDAIYIP